MKYCVLVRENKESPFLSYITRMGLFKFGIKHTRWCIYKYPMAIFKNIKSANKAIEYIKKRCACETFFDFEIRCFENENYIEVKYNMGE